MIETIYCAIKSWFTGRLYIKHNVWLGKNRGYHWEGES